MARISSPTWIRRSLHRLEMNKPKVIVTRRWPHAVETELAERYDVSLNDTDEPMSAQSLQAALGSADAVCPTVTDALDAAVFAIDEIRAGIIGNFGVGFNHIDVDTARRRKLIVTNTPEVLTDCTADLAVMLMLMVARRAGEGERHLRAGAWTGWRPTHMIGAHVTGKTLGLIGFGCIARAVAHRAYFGFGMRIVFTDPCPPPEEVAKTLGARDLGAIEDVIAAADFVSLHCPGGEATRHLLNASRIAGMKETAFLINTARGDVVDQEALIDALTGERIAGAALDVYEGEPAVPHALKLLENVVLLPHLGSAALETRIAMGMRVIDNLDAFFAGREPPDRVA